MGNISRKLALAGLTAAVLLGIVTSVILIVLDFQRQIHAMDATAEELLDVWDRPASTATFRLDDVFATNVVSSLTTYQYVTEAHIQSDFEANLAFATTPSATENVSVLASYLPERISTFERILVFDDAEIGMLSIKIDRGVMIGDFASRSLTTLVLGVLRNLLLLAVLLIVYERYLTAPLLNFITSLRKVDPKKPQAIGDVVGRHGAGNELEVLNEATNTVLEQSAAHLADLDSTNHELLFSEDRFKDFAELGADWLWELDKDGNTMFLSPQFEKQTGHKIADVLGKPWREVMVDQGGEMQPLYEVDHSIVLTGSSEVQNGVTGLLRRADGTEMNLLFSFANILNDDGTFRGVRGVTRDQTAILEAEAEQVMLNQQLRQAERLKAIGQLSGGVAHDFNNILAIIRGNIEMISADTQHEDVPHMLNVVDRASRRAADLTHQLLAYARQQALQPSTVDVNQLIGDLSILLEPALGERVQMETVASRGLWNCRADQSELEAVILNLAINASDAMPEGGKLTIEAYNARIEDTLPDEPFLEPGQYVCIAVTDNGHGMSSDVKAKAFEPFFTTKGVSDGSGLGLSMAYGFAKQSKGHITLYSEENLGTTVKLYMPRVNARAKPIAESEDIPVVAGTKVMVVEDDRDVLETVARFLMQLDCDVIQTNSAEEALTLGKELKNIDLFLIDVVLPGSVNGKNLSLMLTEYHPDTPTVFMSGYTENSIIHNGQLDSGVVLLKKPFSQGELAKVIDANVKS